MLSLVLLCALLLGAAQCAPFEVTVSTLDWYRVGEEVECELTLVNTLEQDLILYHRNIPIEGRITSDSFKVADEVGKLSYDGLVFKRMPISKHSESTLVPAGSSLRAKVDLSVAYSLKDTGVYTVQFTNTIYYQTATASNITKLSLTSHPRSFEMIDSEGKEPRMTTGEKMRLDQAHFKISVEVTTPLASAKDPLFVGDGDDVDKTIAKKAWDGAYDAITKAPAIVDKAGDQYVTWFGAKDEGRQDTVKGMFERVQQAMEETQYTLYFHGQECERDDFAYSSPGGVLIYLCNSYFRAQDTHDCNSKLGTFVNELTIMVGETEEFNRIFTPEECKDLAIDVPLKAIRSAYNYEYFIEQCES